MSDTIHGRIGERAVTAAIWLVAVRLLAKSIDFVTLLILARLLTPADFGLVAIAMTLIFIVEAVLELPINQALVRQPRIDRVQLDTAFTIALLRGLVLAAFIAVTAYPFAYLYGDPRLVGLVLALSWAPALRGLISPQLAVYARKIDFRRDFAIDLVSKLVSLVGSVGAAWLTHSYWALVVGTVMTPLVMMLGSYVLAPYRPRLSLAEWPIFAGFVGWSTVTQMMGALSWQVDRLVLGRFATRRDLGIFTLANDLSYIPEQALIKPIMRPLMSAFVHIGDDPAAMRHAYERASIALLAIGGPVMLGLCLLADPIVRLMLGDRWLPAIPILQILPLSLILPLLSAPFWSLAMAAGRPRLVTWQIFIDLLIRSSLLAGGAITAGVEGVVLGRIVASVLSALWAAWCVRLLTGASVVRQFAAAWRPVLAGLAMAGVVYLLRPLTAERAGVELALAVTAVTLTGAITYAAVLFGSWSLVGGPEGIESWCADQLRRRLRRGPAPAVAYIVLSAERWQTWHQAGELATHEAADEPELLMPGQQFLLALGSMSGRLATGVLIQVDLVALGLTRDGRLPDRLPFAGVRRFFYLRDLITPAVATNVIPMRRYQASA